MRAMALDIGDKRIGIAFSDPLFITAQPYQTYSRVEDSQDIDYFCRLIVQEQVSELVCGLPRNMDGSEGFQAEHARAFAQKLESACGLAAQFVDERLTTAAARRTLSEGGVRGAKRKKIIDTLAAVQILQSYLQAREN